MVLLFFFKVILVVGFVMCFLLKLGFSSNIVGVEEFCV